MTEHTTRTAASLAAALAVGALLTAGSAAAAAFEHPDFATNTRRPGRIVVLPPQSEIIRTRVTDATPLVSETASLENGVAEGVAGSLDALGYDGDAAELDPARVNADRELQSLVKELQDRIDGLLGNVTQRPKDVRAGRFTLGEAVLPLASRTNAEGFLVVRAQSIVPSKGQRALAAVLGVAFGGVPVPPTNVTRGIVALIDARTGDVAWLNAAQVSGAVVKEPELVGGRLAAAMLRNYPKAGEIRKAKGGKRKAERGPSAPQPDEDGPDDAEGIIAAFESVAGESAPVEPAQQDPAAAAAPAEPVASAEPPAPAEPPVEEVAARNEFNGQDGMAGRASQATATETTATEATATTSATAAPPPDAATGADQLAPIRAMWDLPAPQRPAPTRQVLFQMLDGGPGLVLRNMSEPAVRVSVDLGAWIDLAAGERRELPIASGSHRILVTSAEGAEIARASCIVGSASLASAEVWPL